jgi:copper transport protein
VLTATEPARGAQLERAPEEVVFRFNEPVEASFGAVRVFDSAAEQVDDGEVTRPGNDAAAIGVGLEPDLPDGTYTATYRVVSADSHPISGGFVFTVGDPPAGSAVPVGDLIDDAGAGPVTDAALGVARVATYTATALLIGGLAFLVWCWTPALAGLAGADGRWRAAAGAFGSRLRLLLVVGVGVGMAATAAGIVLQGALALGTSFWDALSPSVIGDVLGTRFGEVWGLRFLVLAVLGGLLFVPAVGFRFATLREASLGAAGAAPADPLPASPFVVAATGVALGFLALAPGLAGHPSVGDPRWLSLGANFVHVLAFSVWAGGLVAIVFALPAATSRLEAGERTGLLAETLIRFSGIALVSVAVLLASGIAQAVIQLDSLADLVETGYGRAILVKAGLLGLLVGLGAVNRRRSVPAMVERADARRSPGEAGVVLRRTLRAEIVLIGGVLAATAVLAASSPTAATGGPFSASAPIGGATLELTVDPAAAGPNEIHIYLFDRETGAQYEEVKELTVRAELPAEDVGPLEIDTRKAGPGHYVARNAPLGVSGDWVLEVAARVSAFEQNEADVEVPIR